MRGARFTLGPEDYLVEGTSPSDISYSVIQGPKTGFFIREGSNEDYVRQFTQAQVNKRTIIFVQKGPEKEGSFTFRVFSWDFHPVTRVVRVVVSPLTLSLVNASRIDYRQGSSYVLLNRNHLGADSNGPRENIFYNITVPPQNGSFLWVGKHEKTTGFSQADVDRKRILYAQMNMEAWRDAFQFEVSNSQNKIRSERLELRVLPAVVQHSISVRPGKSVALSSQILDATELEDKSPVFSIIRPPTYGFLYKIIPVADSSAPPVTVREKRDGKRRKYGNGKRIEVDFFTMEDLKMNSIEYVNTLEKAHNPLEDHFIYELRANDVQPARGRFIIQILSQDASGSGSYYFDTSTLKATPTSTGKPDPWLPAMTENFLVVVFVLAAILFASVLFCVFRKVRISKERKKRFEKEMAVNAQLMAPTGGEILENRVYASIGTRTSSFRVKNGLVSGMCRSATLDRPSKGTQVTPPPKYHTLNRDGVGEGTGRMVTFDPGRTEVISSLPMCKVTPLMPRSGPPSGIMSNSSSLDEYNRYAYQYSSSASDTDLKTERLSLDRATGYKSGGKKKTTGPGSHPPPAGKVATRLKENQYWV